MRALVVASVVSVLAGFGGGAWLSGLWNAAEVAELKRSYAEQVADAVSVARATEAALRADIERIQTHHAQEQARAKAASDRLVADLRAGARRLSVPAACPGGDPGDSTTAGGRREARAELDPAAAADLVAIAADGDDAIRALNACVDAYEAARGRVGDTSAVLVPLAGRKD